MEVTNAHLIPFKYCTVHSRSHNLLTCLVCKQKEKVWRYHFLLVPSIRDIQADVHLVCNCHWPPDFPGRTFNCPEAYFASPPIFMCTVHLSKNILISAAKLWMWPDGLEGLSRNEPYKQRDFEHSRYLKVKLPLCSSKHRSPMEAPFGRFFSSVGSQRNLFQRR